MTGDAVKIDRLYREMTGEAPEEDLSEVWPVQLGAATEELNLRWFEKKNYAVIRRGDVVQHPYLAWAACTLDGWCAELECPVEVKHVGGREPIEVVIDRYQPQMQWQMECTGADQCAISIIQGADAPLVEFIERDTAYADEMIARGAQFMACVRERRPPVALEPVPGPIGDAGKIYDMTTSEKWQRHALSWLQSKGAADTAKECEKVLKAMVPDDAKRCIGHGVRISRDRAGRLSLREGEE